jgi:hypothetical protein
MKATQLDLCGRQQSRQGLNGEPEIRHVIAAIRKKNRGCNCEKPLTGSPGFGSVLAGG